MDFDPSSQSSHFQEVEFDSSAQKASFRYVETASCFSLVSTLLLLIVLLVLHAIAMMPSPQLSGYRDEAISIDSSSINGSVNIDLMVSSLVPAHQYLKLNCSAIRIDPHQTNQLPISYSSQSIMSHVHKAKGSKYSDILVQDISFPPESVLSYPFEIFADANLNYDKLRLKMQIDANFANIAGFNFSWVFGNPSTGLYATSAFPLMSYLVLYMLIVYLIHNQRDDDTFTHVCCVCLGITGYLSMNPLATFIEQFQSPVVSSILHAYFICVYRFTLITGLQMCLHQSITPKTNLSIACAIFLSVCAIVEVVAISGDKMRNSTNAQSPSKVEQLMVGFEVLFVVICILYSYRAFTSANITRRMIMYAGISIVSSLLALVARVIAPLTTGHSLNFFMTTTYLTLASYIIFLLHHNHAIEYKPVGGKNEDGQTIDVDYENKF